MSLLNIVWSPDRVLVAVDTQVYAPLPSPDAPHDGPCEAQKMLHLPAAGTVLACRGSAAMLIFVSMDLMLKSTGKPATMDTLLKLLPGAAMVAHGFCLADAKKAGNMAHAQLGYEVALAGWSPSRSRMVALVVYLSGPGAAQQSCELDADMPTWLVPSWEDVPEPDPTSADQLMALARRQVARTRELGDRGFGGRLICADMTRERVDVRELGTL